MAFSIYIYITFFYYYCCYYKSCLHADEWKVHCAWRFRMLLGGKSVYMTQILQKDATLQNAVITQWSCCFVTPKKTFNLRYSSQYYRNWSTSMIRILCETLIVMQFVKNYPAFYVIDNFITMFTRLRFHPLGSCDRASWAKCEEREKNNKMQQSDVYYQLLSCLNMFRASLCTSSGEPRPCVTAYGFLCWFCWMWLVAVVGRCFVGCEHCSHPTTQRPTTATNHIPAWPEQHTKCSNRAFDLLKMDIMMPETCWDRS